MRRCSALIDRRTLRVTLCVAGVLGALAGGAAAATTSTSAIGKTVVVDDRSGDAIKDGIDLVRVSFGRTKAGLLRAAISTRADFAPTDLRARSGPPGSICMQLWTVTVASNNPPDFLVCVTANAGGDALRASIMRDRPDQLPTYIGAADITRSSEHNVTLRFSQSSIGKPATIAFALEATKSGCARISCIDSAPDAPTVATLKLRARTTATG